MSLLHTVNKSPFASTALDDCLARMTTDAGLLLIEDGVYAALSGTPQAARLAGRRVFALAPDLAARGLAERPLADGVELVDYDGFVRLCTEYSAVQSWF